MKAIVNFVNRHFGLGGGGITEVDLGDVTPVVNTKSYELGYLHGVEDALAAEDKPVMDVVRNNLAVAGAWANQEGGDHYKGMTIQPMQYSLTNGLDAAQHTVVKYVSRFRKKGGLADLRKAKHVIDLLIEHEQKRGMACE